MSPYKFARRTLSDIELITIPDTPPPSPTRRARRAPDEVYTVTFPMPELRLPQAAQLDSDEDEAPEESLAALRLSRSDLRRRLVKVMNRVHLIRRRDRAWRQIMAELFFIQADLETA